MTKAKNDPKEVFAENLERARKRLAKSQDKLAKDVGLTRQAIFKYERAEVNPSMDVVFRLADALQVDVEYFFRKNTELDDFNRWLEIVGITRCEGFTKVNYREGHKLTDDVDLSIKTETYNKLVQLLAIEDITNDRVDFKNPVESLSIASKEDAEKAALEVRKKWQLHENAVASVVNLLETKGIRVFEIDADEKFQGFSARYGELPIIVLNFKSSEVTRKRFTAFHELGHLILQIEDGLDYDAIEKICDAFAATMLLPKQILLLEFGSTRKSLKAEEIHRIKEMYGISVQAILVRAQAARIISWDEYEKLYRMIPGNVNAGSRYEAVERPTRFKRLLSFAETEGLIDDRRKEKLCKGEVKDKLLTEAL